jgi:hypothetical protein
MIDEQLNIERDLQYEMSTEEIRAKSVIKAISIILDLAYPSSKLLQIKPVALKEKQYLGSKIRDCVNNIGRYLNEI